jgi:hypothetical protein
MAATAKERYFVKVECKGEIFAKNILEDESSCNILKKSRMQRRDV